MKNFIERLLLNLKLRQELLLHSKTVITMQLNLALYILVAVLMVLVILSFVFFVVLIRCRRRKKREEGSSDWIRSASIEHLRFSPGEIEAHRASTPYDFEMASVEDFVRSQNNNRGIFHSEYVNPLEIGQNLEVIEKNIHKSRPLFQTFGTGNEPKYIYWETRV